jgi:hypothetical protein
MDLRFFNGGMKMFKEINYKDIRKELLAGDIIAFSGPSWKKWHGIPYPTVSRLIKRATRGPVSHIGIVLKTVSLNEAHVYDDKLPEKFPILSDNKKDMRYFVEVIESTSLNGSTGVMRRRLSDVIATYKGKIWALRLNREKRNKIFNEKAFFDHLYKMAEEKRGYDYLGALRSAIDLPWWFGPLAWLTKNSRDSTRLFCSELAMEGLVESGYINKRTVGNAKIINGDGSSKPLVMSPINPAEWTPMDVAQCHLYEKEYWQLKGERSKISGFNGVPIGNK